MGILVRLTFNLAFALGFDERWSKADRRIVENLDIV